MIDTIKIHIPTDNIPKDFYDTTYPKLRNKRFTENDIGERWGTAMFHNFLLNFNSWGITISGSLPKYYLETNQYTLTGYDFASAIQKMEDELKIDLKSCSVIRLDLADNIITQQPVSNYYKYLGEARALTRVRLNNGIEYRNTNRTIIFYDKVKELRKTGVPLIPILSGKNILRLETRFMNNSTISRVLKIPKVKVIDLINNYNSLINIWLSAFKGIFKRHDLMAFDPKVFTQAKGFEKQLMLAGTESMGGAQYILELIKEARQMKLFKYNNGATNLTRRMKQLFNTPVLTQKSILVEELEKKVDMVVLASHHYTERV